MGGFNGVYLNEYLEFQTNNFLYKKNKKEKKFEINFENEKNIKNFSKFDTNSIMNLNLNSEWEEVFPLGEKFSPRTGHTICVLGDKFYMFGGSDNQSVLSELWCFHVSNNFWQRISYKGCSLKPRSGSRFSVYKDKLYLTGGYTKRDGEYFDSLISYNPQTSEMQ